MLFQCVTQEHCRLHAASGNFMEIISHASPALSFDLFLTGFLQHGSTNHENAPTKFGINHVDSHVREADW